MVIRNRLLFDEVKHLPLIETETELIKRASEGNPEAFEVLVQRYQKYVYNLALSVIGNRDEAFDAAQETFIRAWRSLKDFRGDARFSTWIYRIAYRVSLTVVARKRPLPIDDLPEPICEDASANPEEAAENDYRQALLRRAIMNLAPAYRTALILYHLEDLSYEEIASITGVPIGTVRTHLHRGRNYLKREIVRLSGGDENEM
ncbi:MAG TPA: RNA polymerase subunit sigma-24 [Firmicutes bacterium]|jgi:RNA polymerase sigma-70 factor (ECF subfamily)|nr:RNA polymerase subunit sigma-24 [Bacillota bacterium]HCF91416.1 RNA polymerase subunit sigma-24 [Bacillota bacterium]